MAKKRLSPKMAELMEAIRKGEKVIHMEGLNAYYFREKKDNRGSRNCSATVCALMARGLVEHVRYNPISTTYVKEKARG